MTTYCWLLLLLASGSGAMAQRDKPVSPGKSHLYARSQAGKEYICLRWAPSDERAWKYGNQYGYVVERATIMRNDTLLPVFEVRISKGIRPRSLPGWETIVQHNDYAAVMAQALYGDQFNVQLGNKKGIAQIMNQTEELKQRFVMSMYAADLSFEAARFAGLGLIDKGVKKNERYLYRIYTLIPRDKMVMDTALTYIGMKDYQTLPQAPDINTEFSNRAVTLSWEFDALKDHYTSYWIERSADSGRTFSRITSQPVTNLTETKMGHAGSTLMYIDTLVNNETTYQYRIAGVSLFGETGPYSVINQGKGIDNLVGVPAITGIAINDKGKMILNWEFDDSMRFKVKEFQLQRAAKVNGPYEVIRTGLPAQSSHMELDGALPGGYLTITAVHDNGYTRSSFPYLFQAEDSTAPAIPAGLTGEIDTAGVTTLHWNANTENDLLGYKLYRTYVKGQEFTTITDTVWRQTTFRDTASMKLLNRKVYYAVTALDNRYNQSGFSPAVEVTKPDVIPPSAPSFADYRVAGRSIYLHWNNSSSDDVIAHRLYRRQVGDDTARWILQREMTDRKITEFTDTAIEANQTYHYTLVAVDDARLESPPAPPLTLTASAERIKEAFKRIEAAVDRDQRTITVAWQRTTAAVQLELYRGEGKTPMNLYKVLTPDVNGFVDTGLMVNTKYKYGIRAVYADGKYSDFKIKEVIY